MTLRLTIQPEAADEANEAHNWYENQVSGLGGEFYRELTRCIELIIKQPVQARIVYRGLRRKLDRFPFLVFYRITEKELTVVSVFPGSRDSGIWKKRASKF